VVDIKHEREADSIVKSDDSYRSYLKKLKDFGKTNTLKMETTTSTASVSTGGFPRSLKPSLRNTETKHTSIKVETLNSSYK